MAELSALTRASLEAHAAIGRKVQAVRARDEVIRTAYGSGTTIWELAQATGLSRAQVQRICDYSKDRRDPQNHDPLGCLYCESGEAMKHNPEYSKDRSE